MGFWDNLKLKYNIEFWDNLVSDFELDQNPHITFITPIVLLF